jgi:hypothetical protein
MRKGLSRSAILSLALAAGAALGSAAGFAGEPAPAPAPSADKNLPQEVTVGIYVNQINQISLKENYLVGDFYVWFRWRDDELKPFETFGIIDGTIESRGEAFAKKLPDGQNYAYIRVVARFTKYWDIHDFPLDDHDVEIVVEEEDKEDHLVVYEADVQNSAVSPRIRVPGWRLTGTASKAGTGVYRSNFGDLSVPPGNETRYGNVSLTLQFRREGGSYFVKTFLAVWISSMIAFLCFFIKPTDVDPRFGLSVGALFASVASEYIVVSSLPDTNVITLADKIHIFSFVAVLVVIAESTLSLWAMENNREALSKKLDRIFRVVVPATYLATNILLVALR